MNRTIFFDSMLGNCHSTNNIVIICIHTYTYILERWHTYKNFNSARFHSHLTIVCHLLLVVAVVNVDADAISLNRKPNRWNRIERNLSTSPLFQDNYQLYWTYINKKKNFTKLLWFLEDNIEILFSSRKWCFLFFLVV